MNGRINFHELVLSLLIASIEIYLTITLVEIHFLFFLKKAKLNFPQVKEKKKEGYFIEYNLKSVQIK